MTTINDTLLPGAAIVEAEIHETPASGAVALTDPTGGAAEQYRVLRHRLEHLAKADIRTLAFTSPQSGEGKTTTAVNAAVTLGRGGRNRVALVDLDLRRPQVASMLGLRVREGLCDVVAGRTSLGNCLWKLGGDQTWVLPAGAVPDDPARVLYDPRLGEILTELRARHDFVIVDVPPALPQADAATVCQYLDGAILVVRANATERDLIGAALESLYGVRVHGIVLNAVPPDSVVTQLRALGAASEPGHAMLPPAPLAALPEGS
jgi:capsular exopolysaccharide synthesis family protein